MDALLFISTGTAKTAMTKIAKLVYLLTDCIVTASASALSDP